MQTVRTMIAARRGVAAAGSSRRRRRRLRAVRLRLQHRPAAGRGVPDVPTDYRLRHPITISEADRTLEIFIGSNRGELSATQRAEVLAFAQTWKREATGGVLVDLPVGTSNERAAAEAMREIRSILAASGVPADGIIVRSYHPPGAQPRHHPHHLSEDQRPSRALRSVAAGYRAEPQPRAISKISRPGTSAAPANATSLPWSTTRPIWCSRAPKRRPIRCGAPRSSKNIAHGTSTATQYPTTDTAKISYRRWPMMPSS